MLTEEETIFTPPEWPTSEEEEGPPESQAEKHVEEEEPPSEQEEAPHREQEPSSLDREQPISFACMFKSAFPQKFRTLPRCAPTTWSAAEPLRQACSRSRVKRAEVAIFPCGRPVAGAFSGAASIYMPFFPNRQKMF